MNNQYNEIVRFMSPHDLMSGGSYPNPQDWEHYFSVHYGDEVKTLESNGSFMTYKDKPEEVVVLDYISYSPRDSYKLANSIINLAEKLKKPLMAYIHFSNYAMLNMAIARFKFRVVGNTNNQLLLRRS